MENVDHVSDEIHQLLRINVRNTSTATLNPAFRMAFCALTFPVFAQRLSRKGSISIQNLRVVGSVVFQYLQNLRIDFHRLLFMENG